MAVEKDVRSELGKLPVELKEQYKIIYRDILESAHSTSSIARKTFSWILASKRILTVDEMIAAVALDDDGFCHADLDIPRLLDICRNLVAVTSIHHASNQRAFQMVHLSVREFLEALPEFSAEEIHTVAVSRLLGNFNWSLRRERNNNTMREKSLQALRNYTIYLFDHAEKSLLATPECDLAPKMISFLFDNRYDPTAMLNEWHDVIDEFCERSVLPQDSVDWPFYEKKGLYQYKESSSLQLVCAHGLLSILQILGNDGGYPWEAQSSEHRRRALLSATGEGKFAIAKWLLERHIVHPDEGHGHVSALWFAVRDQQEEMVNLLLEYGADPLSRHEIRFRDTPWNMVFSSPLKFGLRYPKPSFAIFKRMFDSIELLHKEIPGRKVLFDYDWRLEGLFESLQANWDEASHFLIRRGANDCLQMSQRADSFVNNFAPPTSTLQVAVERSGFSVIEALLDRSLQRNSGRATQSIISLPLESKEHLAYVNHLDTYRRSALHCLMGRQSSSVEEDEEIMRLLLKYGADPAVVSQQKHTAIHVAAAIGSPDMIRHLVGAGLDLEARDRWGATALHLACRYGHQSPRVIRYLTDNGQEPLGRDSAGRTPLHSAVRSCNLPALEALLDVLLARDGLSLSEAQRVVGAQSLDRNADIGFGPYEKLVEYVNVVDDEGKSLLHMAGAVRNWSLYVEKNDAEETVIQIQDTVRLLVNCGATVDSTAGGKTSLPPLLALLSHDGDGAEIAAKELLKQGANPKIGDSKGATALHHKTSLCDDKLVEDLLNAGCDIEAKDDDLCTPLHWACRSLGHPQMAKKLLLHGADCRARDRTGATPLHHAAKALDTHHAAAMLIDKGADVQCADEFGATPLHLAAKAGNHRTALTLIRYNANPEAVDMGGKTAMHYAAEYASIVGNGWDPYRRGKHVTTWLHIFKCSEQWCQQNKTRPRTLFKRPRSQILQNKQFWGDFSQIKSDALTRP